MERRLARLLDYQKFERESGLQALINDVEKRYPSGSKVPLQMKDLFLVAAAGETAPLSQERERIHGRDIFSRDDHRTG